MQKTLSEGTFRAEPLVKPSQTRGPRLQYGGKSPASEPVLATAVKTHIRSIDGVVLPSKPTAAKSKARASRSSKIMRRFKRASTIKKMKVASTSYATLGKYIMEAVRAEKRIADLLKQF